MAISSGYDPGDSPSLVIYGRPQIRHGYDVFAPALGTAPALSAQVPAPGSPSELPTVVISFEVD